MTTIEVVLLVLFLLVFVPIMVYVTAKMATFGYLRAKKQVEEEEREERVD